MHEQDYSPSWCQQLDVEGMQPHSREYLEYRVMAERSASIAKKLPGVRVSYDDGIQHSGKP